MLQSPNDSSKLVAVGGRVEYWQKYKLKLIFIVFIIFPPPQLAEIVHPGYNHQPMHTTFSKPPSVSLGFLDFDLVGIL